MKNNENKSLITITCKDGSKRVINSVGRWSNQMAKELAIDIEGANVASVEVIIL